MPEQTSAAANIADVPVPDVTTVSDTTGIVSDSLSNIPTETLASLSPLQYGDFAALGLTGWGPGGLARWGLELFNVSTGLPWFWTIAGFTVVTRLMLIPFAVRGMRSAAKLGEHQPQIQAQAAKMKEAFAKGDQFEIQKLSLQQRALYARIGVNPLSTLVPMLVQIPVTLGTFFGVKGICELPVEQLKWSGLSFLPDLTVPDPTWVLPIVTVVAINLQLTATLRDAVATPATPHILNVMRVMTVASVYLFSTWPAGLTVSVLSGIFALTCQTFILRVPAVRRLVSLPPIKPGKGLKTVSLRETYEFIRQWVAEQIAQGKKQNVKTRSEQIQRRRR